MSARRFLVATLAAVILAGCGGGAGTDDAPAATPSPTSTALTGECLSAMRDQLREAFETPDAPAATRPEACEGVSDAELQRAADILLSEMFPPDETP